MNKKITIFYFFIIFLTAAYSQEKARLAVLDFEAKGIPNNTAQMASELLRTEIINTNTFEVIERSEMSKIFKEQAFSMTGAVNVSKAVKAGKLLSAKKILIGSITKWKNKIIINGRLIDIEKGVAEFAHKETITSLDDLDKGVELYGKNLSLKVKGLPVISSDLDDSEESGQDNKVVQERGLIAWYNFNGNAKDSSGHGLDGRGNGVQLSADRNGKANSAFYFNGNSYIDCGNNPLLNITGKQLTVTCWIKISEYPNEQKYIASKWDPGYSWILALNSNGSIGFVLFPGEDLISPFPVMLNKWHQIIGIYDGNEQKIYLDGVKIASKKETRSINMSYASLIVGRHHNHYGHRFIGNIDELRIYNKALSQAEIKFLFKE